MPRHGGWMTGTTASAKQCLGGAAARAFHLPWTRSGPQVPARCRAGFRGHMRGGYSGHCFHTVSSCSKAPSELSRCQRARLGQGAVLPGAKQALRRWLGIHC